MCVSVSLNVHEHTLWASEFRWRALLLCAQFYALFCVLSPAHERYRNPDPLLDATADASPVETRLCHLSFFMPLLLFLPCTQAVYPLLLVYLSISMLRVKDNRDEWQRLNIATQKPMRSYKSWNNSCIFSCLRKCVFNLKPIELDVIWVNRIWAWWAKCRERRTILNKHWEGRKGEREKNTMNHHS